MTSLKKNPENQSHRRQTYPLSGIQLGLLFHYLKNQTSSNPHHDIYNTQIKVELHEAVNVRRLNAAWHFFVSQHELLRSHIIDIATPTPLFKIDEHPRTHIDVIDLCQHPNAKQELGDFIYRDLYRHFDLEHETPIQLTLIKLHHDHWQLVITFHHILMAGISAMMCVENTFKIYDQLSHQQHAYLPHAQSYARYVEFTQRRHPRVEKKYWQSKLADAPYRTTLQLPNKSKCNAKIPHGYLTADISRDDTNRLRKFAKAQRVTMNTLMLAAWGIVLQRYCSTDVLAIGSVRALPKEVVDNLACMMINTLPVVIDSQRKKTVSQLLQSIKVQQDALKNVINTPLQQIMKWCDIENSEQIFNSVVDYKPIAPHAYFKQLNEYWFTRDFTYKTTTNYVTTLEIYDDVNALTCRLCYDKNRLSQFFAKQLLDHFVFTLQQLAAHQHEIVSTLDLLPPTAREKIVNRWNNTHRDYASDDTITSRITQQAERFPESLAIIHKNQSLNFSLLRAATNALAKKLLKVKGLPIAVVAPRSIEAIVGYLAIMKVGGSYIPIDPHYPAARIAHIIGNSRANLILTTNDARSCIKSRKPILTINLAELLQQHVDDIDHSSAEQIAYTIYTSGTTGKPKGVDITQRSLCNLVAWHGETYGVNQHTRASHFENISFDASAWAIWSYLGNGGCLVIGDEELLKQPHHLVQWFAEQKITIGFLATPLAEIIMRMKMPAGIVLKYLLTGGDLLRLHSAHTQPFKLINHYGPTENTVVTTMNDSPSLAHQYLLGKPIANHQVFVLDAHRQLCPIGVCGELFVAGVGLAKGYHHNRALTEERFITHLGRRMYRTGDIVRWTRDGKLEFVGRDDNQVQIRGFRVELQEIEKIACRHPDIGQCIVTLSGKSTLHAHVIAKNKPVLQQLHQYFMRVLPSYMVPHQIHFYQKFPLTPHGKIDYEKLIVSEDDHTKPSHDSAEIELIKNIYAHVLTLRAEKISANDNYFSLGGDSIASISVSMKFSESGYEINPNTIFEHPVINDLALHLNEHRHGYQSLQKVDHIDFNAIQLWYLDCIGNPSSLFSQKMIVDVESNINFQQLRNAITQVISQSALLNSSVTHSGFVCATQPWQGVILDKINERDLILSHQQSSEKIAVQLSDRDHQLVMLIHHLKIDALSWISLLDEISYAYHCIDENVPYISRLSFDYTRFNRTFSHQQITHSQSSLDIPYQQEPLFTRDHYETLHCQFSHRSADSVFHDVVNALRSVINDTFIIDVELHGRDQQSTHDNISRAIGWFTQLIPITVTPDQPTSTLVPQLHQPAVANAQYDQRNRSHIAFNYIAKQTIHSPIFSSSFTLALLSDNQCIAPHVMMINTDGENLQLQYNMNFFKRDDMQHVLNHLSQASSTFALTPLQLGMIFRSQQEPERRHYFVQTIVELHDEIDPQQLKNSCQLICSQYDILHTHLSAKETTVFTMINDAITWQYSDWHHLSQRDFLRRKNEWLLSDREIGFDDAKKSLIRFHLIKQRSNRYHFVISHHHVILDGWSLSRLLKLIFDDMKGQHIAPRTQFSDYVHWQQRQPISDGEFWKNYLAGFTQPTQLSLENHRDEWGCDTKTIKLSSAFTRKIENASKRLAVTPNNIFQTAFALALSHFSGKKEVLFGITHSTRNATLPFADEILGLLIATLPTRFIAGDRCRSTLMQQQHDFAQQLTHQFTTLTQIHKLSDIDVDKSLFDYLYAYENYPATHRNISSAHIHSLTVNEQNDYKMTLLVTRQDQFFITANYAKRFFTPESITEFLQAMKTALTHLISSGDPICDSRLCLSANEKNRLAKRTGYPAFPLVRTSLTRSLEKWARTTPNKMAFHDQNRSLTFSQMNAHINQIAHWLQSLSVKKGDIVAICLNRSLDVIAIYYALLKLNAAYLPLDPTHPNDRLNLILRDAKPSFVITHQSLQSQFTQSTVIAWEEIDTHRFSKKNPSIKPDLKQLAYILYTSGSTGVPKGVMIEQHSLVNVIHSVKKLLKLNQRNHYLAICPFTFDISGLEIHLPMITGATLCVYPQKVDVNARDIFALIEKHKVDLLVATPLIFQLFLTMGWQHAHRIKLLCMGEPLLPQLAQQLHSPVHDVWNMFGPTETTIITTAYHVSKNDFQQSHISIGNALHNQTAVILDELGNPVANNVVGELYIGGEGVARGYLNAPEKTAERFLEKKWGSQTQTLYRTGDLAIRRSDGNLIFIGRADQQIKIHGYRIELGEIEMHLREIKSITQAVVLCKNPNTPTATLCAFIQSNTRDVDAIKNQLAHSLPYYMIPQRFIFVDHMPRNSNDKIDKESLLRLDVSAPSTMASTHTATEKLVSDVWAKVLDQSPTKISLHDHFFTQGGDSLTAIVLLARLEELCSVSLQLRDLFAFATVEQLAKLIDERRSQQLPVNGHQSLHSSMSHSLITLQAHHNNEPLFLIHPIGGTVFCYLPLVKALQLNAPIYAIQDPGIHNKSLLFESLRDMAKAYCDLIQSKQPHGPYRLCGASFGANMSVEVARELTARGEQVAFVGLIDGWAMYPAKANHDRLWFDSNLKRQHQMLKQLLPHDLPMPDLLLDLLWHRQQLIAQHPLTQFDFPVVLFKSETVSPVLRSIDATLNHWDRFCHQQVSRYLVPGDHETVLLEPHVHVLARAILAALAH